MNQSGGKHYEPIHILTCIFMKTRMLIGDDRGFHQVETIV